MTQLAKYKINFSHWTSVDFALGIILLLLIPCIKWIPLLMIFTGCLWIWEFYKNRNQFQATKFSLGWIELGMIALFVLLLLGMLWTENVEKGWSNVEHKLSLLLVPIIFGLRNRKMKIQDAGVFFIVGLAIASILLLSIAAYRSLFDGTLTWTSYWKESTFSVFMHRSYLACYMSMGALISLIYFFKVLRWYFLFAFILLSAMVLLTVSKAGIIALILGFFSLVFYFVIWQKSGAKVRVIMVLAMVMLPLMLGLNSRVRIRFGSAWNSFFTAEVMNNPSKDGTQARMMMWSAATEVFATHLLAGVGTGDVDDALQMENMVRHNDGVVAQKLNAHNQFLNQAVQHGILGLVLLISLMTVIIVRLIRNRNLIGVVIWSVFIINLAFESFLETRSGVVPFCLLIMLMSSLNKGDIIIKKESV
jgi:O-antigen ligase